MSQCPALIFSPDNLQPHWEVLLTNTYIPAGRLQAKTSQAALYYHHK